MNQLSQSIYNINNINCILLGDFNFSHINWVNKTADSALSQCFLDSVEEKNHMPLGKCICTRKGNMTNLIWQSVKWYDILCDKTVDQQWMTFKELYEKFVENIFQSSLLSKVSDPGHLEQDTNLYLKLRKIKGRPSLRLEKQGYIAVRHYESSKVN